VSNVTPAARALRVGGMLIGYYALCPRKAWLSLTKLWMEQESEGAERVTAPSGRGPVVRGAIIRGVFCGANNDPNATNRAATEFGRRLRPHDHEASLASAAP
jgi:hypothetical protein